MAPGGILDGVVQRSTLVDHEGMSGAALERATLADGRRLVVKRVTPQTDLTLGLLGGSVAQEFLLWESGGLDRLPHGVGHAVVDAWTEDEDTTVIVMRDLGSSVLTWSDRLDAAACRWTVERLAALHAAYLGDPPAEVTPLVDSIGLFAPRLIATPAQGGNRLLAAAMRGWECFADPAVVPPDVSAAVFAVHDDPVPLAAALAAGPVTLAHGDLATVNMAIEGDCLVLLDWALAAAAPGALDIARLLIGCAHVLDLDPDGLVEAYRDAAGPAYDEGSLRLALFSALCWLGWNKALDVVESSDVGVRARERASLRWWVTAARTALERGVL